MIFSAPQGLTIIKELTPNTAFYSYYFFLRHREVIRGAFLSSFPSSPKFWRIDEPALEGFEEKVSPGHEANAVLDLHNCLSTKLVFLLD